MKAMKNLFVVLALVSVVCVVSCKDDDPVGCNWSTELQAESDALSAAASVYGQNPTPANCEAFRNAYQNYLNSADDLQSCANASGQGAAYQQAISDAQANLDALQC